ncbi:hypothetical protein LCGC14_1676140 [marine sediment metagenome]|uniref:Phosphoadenosine phosphosulphate reductase domain-containing protein n=1 Tax=marine sediment metagenome TaxID=412755 RepID=A0A0F9K5L6_9ZZZZ
MAAESIVNGAGAEQLSLPGVDAYFLTQRLVESRRIVREIAAKSKLPLFIQFSGGRDSMAMLGLVQEVTDNYICTYMATGLEFKGVIPFVKETCRKLGARLMISNPGMHKGNLFKRIETFQSFPGLIATWCCRDLKLRPQKKMLIQVFGKGTFYKLEGIRLSESVRRKYMYKEYTGNPIREDGEFRGSYEVFPIINWTDRDVLNYLEMKGLPTMRHYQEFGLSGCAFCPFYQPDIYKQVLGKYPDYPLYKRVIEWENRLDKPSVGGYYFLRDIKREILTGVRAVPVAPIQEAASPCMMMFEGEMVLTCNVYGHTFLGGECVRCKEPAPEPVS